jgi:hypothetical protein
VLAGIQAFFIYRAYQVGTGMFTVVSNIALIVIGYGFAWLGAAVLLKDEKKARAPAGEQPQAAL